MSDPEIEELRGKVHCAVVLERTLPPWMLDRKESTKLSLKYRRGKGEILIVSHGGRGWWDPTSDAKGDAFSLVQRLEPGINFGYVRKRLREFAGLSPSFPIAERAGRRKSLGQTRRRTLGRSEGRVAGFADLALSRRWKEALPGAGGAKSLFRLPPSAQSLPRLVLAEAAIDALSAAAIESLRADTLYAASGGGMGPGTLAALEALLTAMATLPGALFCSATDANVTGRSLRRPPPIARGKIQRAIRATSASNRRRRLE
jgi:hypothetical protein